MPLIDLKTNLKDLKFGKDRLNGENSNQPFIVSKIPATDEPLQTGFDSNLDINNEDSPGLSAEATFATAAVGGAIGFATGGIGGAAIGVLAGAGLGAGLSVGRGIDITGDLRAVPQAGTGGSDFLIRGNLLLPNAIFNDAIRLTKFFKSTDGILFTIKQNILSRIAARPEYVTFGTFSGGGFLNEGIYTPLSTVLGAVGSPFGLHVNKQGLNPLTGLGKINVGQRYVEKVYDDNSKIQLSLDSNDDLKNRLYGLYYYKISQQYTGSISSVGDSISKALKNNDITDTEGFILSYQGGPNAPFGIGRTGISYAADNTGAPLSVSRKGINYKNKIGKFVTLDYNQISKFGDSTKDFPPKILDFRAALKKQIFDANNTVGSPISNIPSNILYNSKNIEYRTKKGDPGNPLDKNINSYTIGNPDVTGVWKTIINKKEISTEVPYGYVGAASDNSYDSLNAFGLGNLGENASSGPDPYEDLVEFKIQIIDNVNPSTAPITLRFRALLDTISDAYTSDWDSISYVGRGEKFYTYKGFDRKFSLGWTVAATSKFEITAIYRKLNFLASICAPNYSSNGYMGGNIIKLTVGGYLYEQPGIITGLRLEMNNENDTWEIAIDDNGYVDRTSKQLPHIVRVKGFEFIPIHDFVPAVQSLNSYDPNNLNTINNAFGPERYISLKNYTSNNYDLIDPLQVTAAFDPTLTPPNAFPEFYEEIPVPSYNISL